MNNRALIEAILLIETEGSDIQTLQNISGLSKEEITEIIEQLRHGYSHESSGIQLREIRGKLKLLPNDSVLPALSKHYNSVKPKLSRAALEVLAIIAYSQPITRTEIEELRGSNCDSTIRKLVQYELIQEAGRKNTIGNPVLFATTRHFLECFNIGTLNELPALPKEEERKFQRI